MFPILPTTFFKRGIATPGGGGGGTSGFNIKPDGFTSSLQAYGCTSAGANDGTTGLIITPALANAAFAFDGDPTTYAALSQNGHTHNGQTWPYEQILPSTVAYTRSLVAGLTASSYVKLTAKLYCSLAAETGVVGALGNMPASFATITASGTYSNGTIAQLTGTTTIARNAFRPTFYTPSTFNGTITLSINPIPTGLTLSISTITVKLSVGMDQGQYYFNTPGDATCPADGNTIGDTGSTGGAFTLNIYDLTYNYL